MNSQIVEIFRDDINQRSKYYRFIETVFPGLDFEGWYEQRYWTENYIPFSIIEEDKIVSNVSVSKMAIIVNGEPKNGIQIGAVGTIPEYRNRGLSRYLMEYVVNTYDSICDIFFLFANETVLEFYPKFGFNPHKEVIFKSSFIPKSDYSARRLNLGINSDRDIITKYLKQRRILTQIFGAKEYDFITQWHLINVFPENILFVEDEQVIFISGEKENQLHIWDVICWEPINLVTATSKIIQNQDLQSIIYYFPPDQLSFDYDEVIEDKESYLFVRGDFKVRGKDFKFPITAQT